jgi:hypothetical protein
MWPLIHFLPGLLTYSEDFGSAACANALSGRTFVLHCDSLRILDLNLFFALHAICLHFYPLVCKILNRHYHREHCQSIGFVDISSICCLSRFFRSGGSRVTSGMMNQAVERFCSKYRTMQLQLSQIV